MYVCAYIGMYSHTICIYVKYVHNNFIKYILFAVFVLKDGARSTEPMAVIFLWKAPEVTAQLEWGTETDRWRKERHFLCIDL